MTLSRNFYNAETVTVAQKLLGKKLIRSFGKQKIIALIIETEAYKADDPACHAHRGKTERNAALFGPVGHTYVYFTYGMHHCLNIVSREKDQCAAGGVLIRALLPLSGEELIHKFRPNYKGGLLNGPGIVTQALNLNRMHGSCDVTNPNALIYIEEGITIPQEEIISTPRIGISQAKEKLWRFYVRPNFLKQFEQTN